MPTLAVDFDGVVHAYSRGWADGSIYDPPVPDAIDALRTLLEDYRVVIFSTRARDRRQVTAMRAWLRRHGLSENEVGRLAFTHEKPAALAYIDDRAIRFTSWPRALDQLALVAR